MELAQPGDIVEAPEQFLAKYAPKGLPPCGFIDYKNVRACPPGKTEEVEQYLEMLQEELAHKLDTLENKARKKAEIKIKKSAV